MRVKVPGGSKGDEGGEGEGDAVARSTGSHCGGHAEVSAFVLVVEAPPSRQPPFPTTAQKAAATPTMANVRKLEATFFTWMHRTRGINQWACRKRGCMASAQRPRFLLANNQEPHNRKRIARSQPQASVSGGGGLAGAGSHGTINVRGSGGVRPEPSK